jgi:maleylacetoacetate isomerase
MLGHLILYSYWRSSAAYRVRIALNLKHLTYELVPVHLLRKGGEHRSKEFMELNPQGLVPVLTDGGRVMRQSGAIIEYLDEAYPDTPLLPVDIRSRSQVREMSQIVACDIHPLNNLRTLMFLEKEFGIKSKQKDDWYSYWINDGFRAMEIMLEQNLATGEFCEGDDPSMADCFLVPQVYNAKRAKIDMTPYPQISRIYENCMQMEEFVEASPENQPDAE